MLYANNFPKCPFVQASHSQQSWSPSLPGKFVYSRYEDPRVLLWTLIPSIQMLCGPQVTRTHPRQGQLIPRKLQKLHHQLRQATAPARTGLHQSARQIPRSPLAPHPRPRLMPQLTKATRLPVRLAAEAMLLSRSRPGASGAVGLQSAAGPPKEMLRQQQHASQVCACLSPLFWACYWFQLAGVGVQLACSQGNI